jgi:hypothetical protein
MTEICSTEAYSTEAYSTEAYSANNIKLGQPPIPISVAKPISNIMTNTNPNYDTNYDTNYDPNSSQLAHLQPHLQPHQQPPPPYTDLDSLTFLSNIKSSDHINSSYDRIKDVVNKYDISDNFIKQLKDLSRFDIVALFDDSGSMSTMIDGFAYINKTRWHELMESAQMVVDIATCFDADGIDAYFLNFDTYRQINSFDQISTIFNRVPSGTTNISSKLNEIYRNKESVLREKELLILVFTDGEPNNGDSFNNLRKTVKHITQSGRVYVSFIMCTDEDHIVQAYDKHFDKDILNVDVIDDYKSEAKQIKRIQGDKFRFTRGDYIVKVMIGSINQSIDALDERPIDSCCVIS